MDDYSQIMFATQDDRQRWCKVSIKQRKKNKWAGVMVYAPDRLPIWFAINKQTGQLRHNKKLDAIWMTSPILYDRIRAGVCRTFSLDWC